MKFFIDTANLDEIKRVKDMGLLDGVTTNPTLAAKEAGDFPSPLARSARSPRNRCPRRSSRPSRPR